MRALLAQLRLRTPCGSGRRRVTASPMPWRRTRTAPLLVGRGGPAGRSRARAGAAVRHAAAPTCGARPGASSGSGPQSRGASQSPDVQRDRAEGEDEERGARLRRPERTGRSHCDACSGRPAHRRRATWRADDREALAATSRRTVACSPRGSAAPTSRWRIFRFSSASPPAPVPTARTARRRCTAGTATATEVQTPSQSGVGTAWSPPRHPA
jgi:hypothetical protein